MLAAGTSIVHTTERDQVIPADRWLTQARTPEDVAEQIRTELRAELDGGAPTGMRATIDNDELAFLHEWHLVVAQRT
jgi:hypothetical protein